MPTLTTQQILDIQLKDTDIGDVTIKQYLKTLLITLLSEKESFSGKRPFGNSGWEHEIYIGLVREKAIPGELDSDGYIRICNENAADKLLKKIINEAF